MRAVTVSVDFGDILQVTLPRNRGFWDEVMVVTAPHDSLTRSVARNWNAKVFTTDSFYKNNAPFNKFLALEEALTEFGRSGWMALVDADIIWPTFSTQRPFERGNLYSFMRRRLLGIQEKIPPESEWGNLPLDSQDPRRHQECMGFTQIFHCADPALGEPPWHRLDLPTAALGDSLFQQRWPLNKKVWIDADVLHIGECAKNWCGRVEPYRDGTLPEQAELRDKQTRAMMSQLWPTRKD